MREDKASAAAEGGDEVELVELATVSQHTQGPGGIYFDVGFFYRMP